MILALIAIISIPVVNVLTCKAKNRNDEKIAVIGHRGAAGMATENSLAAIDAGIATGADFIEVDIHQTKDKELVIMHDRTLNRTTNKRGRIRDLTYDEINQAVLKGEDDPPQKVPLLREALNKIKSSNAILLIEIKFPDDYPDLQESLEHLIKETNTESNIMLFSFYPEVIKDMKKRLPHVKTGIFCFGFEKIKQWNDVDYICPFWMTLLYNPGIVQKIHSIGAKVFVWTVNSSYWMKYAINRNVDGIITNHPDLMQKTLR
jgi:glycerophosphoryl diester phosphodiesterase